MLRGAVFMALEPTCIDLLLGADCDHAKDDSFSFSSLCIVSRCYICVLFAFTVSPFRKVKHFVQEVRSWSAEPGTAAAAAAVEVLRNFALHDCMPPFL